MWAEGITRLEYSERLGNGPAVVDRFTGVVYLNPTVYPRLPKATRVFVLLHEWGHLVKKTFSDQEADAFAFTQFTKLGYAPELAVQAITGTFPGWQYSVELSNRVYHLQKLATNYGQGK